MALDHHRNHTAKGLGTGHPRVSIEDVHARAVVLLHEFRRSRRHSWSVLWS
uniref:Uncharacterized protein n=1 Tax=Hyaloperonospora arabidopsidis (strain Emoy2) TaxID=559515 RepID=M4C2T8_HYAAE